VAGATSSKVYLYTYSYIYRSNSRPGLRQRNSETETEQMHDDPQETTERLGHLPLVRRARDGCICKYGIRLIHESAISPEVVMKTRQLLQTIL